MVKIGFPVALVLSWMYERTPEGLKATDPAQTVELEAIASQPDAWAKFCGGENKAMGALVGGIYAAGRLDAYKNWVCALEKADVLRFLAEV